MCVLNESSMALLVMRTRYSRNVRPSQMQIKPARFSDAAALYGAFTYYLQPQMQFPEDDGDDGDL